ncbi:MAG: RNA 2',3'-cyclic phosphodiesterase [Candidatus Marsarchaeota archaeon]|nr:RNA 2',3'-cyclic phosphodiesterase [Candidatus Marsarchaeota archaeon]MCL5105825.1 RNA 2',3'-cyclic phosphodiesterase [Candidatus Marsarchaeota archaeon]
MVADNIKKRCFISIPISEDIKNEIEKIYQKIGPVKFIARDNLHITILFLGLIDSKRIEKIREIMQDIKITAFNIRLGGIGVFLKSGVMYVGIKDGGAIKNLNCELVRRIKEGLGMDFGEKQEFHAHLTFARCKNSDKDALKRFIERHKDLDFGVMECNEIDLNESMLKERGAEYKTIFINKLGNNRIIKD